MASLPKLVFFFVLLISAVGTSTIVSSQSLVKEWERDFRLTQPSATELSFSQGGDFLLCELGGNKSTIAILDTKNGDIVLSREGVTIGAFFEGNGSRLLTIDKDRGVVVQSISSGRLVRKGRMPPQIFFPRQLGILSDGTFFGVDAKQQSILSCKEGDASAEVLFDRGSNPAFDNVSFMSIRLIGCKEDSLYAIVSRRMCEISLARPHGCTVIDDLELTGLCESRPLGDSQCFAIASATMVVEFDFSRKKLRKMDFSQPMVGLLTDDQKWLIGYSNRGERRLHSIYLCSRDKGTVSTSPWSEDSITDIDFDAATGRFCAINQWGKVAVWKLDLPSER